MEANEPAYILATSGTTAKPKLAVHTHGGYQVHITRMARWVLRPASRPTCGGRPPTSAGSSATATWSTRRCSSAAPRSRTKARSTIPTRRRSGDRSSRSSASPACSRRRRRSALLMRYGDEPRAEARPRAPRARLLRRRGAQPAGLGVAPERGPRGPHPGHRPHVADRDRRTGLRQPVRHRAAADQARLRRHPAARHRGGGDDAGRAALRARREGHLGHQAAVPRADAGALGRARALRPRLLGADPRNVYFTGDAAHIDEDGYVWFAGRADEIIKIAAHRIGTIEVESGVPAPPGRRRGRRHRPAGRAARRGHLGLRRAQERPRAVGRAAAGAAGRRCAASSGPSPSSAS